MRSAPKVKITVPSGKNTAAWTLVRVADSIWEPGTQAQGLNTYLAIIAVEEHFNTLYDDRHTTGFTGTKDSQPEKTRDCENAKAIQDFFVEVCLSASATLITGLDQTTMEAILTNVIQPLSHQNLSDYEANDSRVVMLVDRYNPTTEYAEGVGVLQVKWTLKIKDYKKKTKSDTNLHRTNIKVDSWSVLYSDTDPMCRDYATVCKKHGIKPQICPP
ncbi:MAG: hypothetical protein F8N37_09555 [Telmatospirillum sp.]|nr:hypothetical protein [Telmatospirillum sp.]